MTRTANKAAKLCRTPVAAVAADQIKKPLAKIHFTLQLRSCDGKVAAVDVIEKNGKPKQNQHAGQRAESCEPLVESRPSMRRWFPILPQLKCTRYRIPVPGCGLAAANAAKLNPMSTQTAAFPAPPSAGVLLPAFTLWWREVIRFYRQRARVIGVIVSPLLFWVVIGSGFGTSFRSGQAAGQQHYLNYFYPGTLVMISLFPAIFTLLSLFQDPNHAFLLSVLVAPVPRAA